MPRTAASLFELELQKPRAGAREALPLLHAQLADAIRSGRLAPGTRLPATREAPGVFGVSRNTAAEVYQRLLYDGLLTARQGAGTFVAGVDERDLAPAGAHGSGLAAARLNPIWRDGAVTGPMTFWSEPAPSNGPHAGAGRGAAGTPPDAPPEIELRPALVDTRHFPFAVLRRLMTRHLRAMETRPPSFRSAQGNQGSHALRLAVTRHTAMTRALAAEPDEVLVTAGAQQAFDLLARVLVVPGETVVAVEEPGYPPLRAAFAAAGARLVPVPVDQHGLVVEAIPPGAAVVCVTPSHQFPLGVTLSRKRRQALLAHARRHHAVIVEDDYDGEFRLDGPPVAALRSGPSGTGSEHVFYVGTFSKCMLPSLRLGFIVAPRWALAALVTAKNCQDWHCALPLQAAVAAFVGEGHLARHVRRMRQLYRERRAALAAALRTHTGDQAVPIESGYGMHAAAWLPDGTDAAALEAGLAQAGVRLHALDRYRMLPGGRPGLVLGYGVATPAGLARAAQLLARALARR